MITSDEIIKSVINSYEESRQSALEKAYRAEQTLLSFDDYESVYYDLKALNLKIARLEFENEPNEKLRTFYEKRDELAKRKAEIINNHGFSEDDLSPEFECAECEDTGYLKNGALCGCFYKKINAAAEKFLGIEKRKLPSFSDFSDDINQPIKKKLFSYCEKFGTTSVKNLIFTGDTGTGKTFAAGAVANEIEKQGKSVLFLSAVKLNEIFFTYHVSNGTDKNAIFDVLTSCDLLVIDDLGTEPIKSNVTVEYLTAFLSERLNENKPFIITTNLTGAEIQKRYTERLLSRLSSDSCAFISFVGKDLRLNRKS